MTKRITSRITQQDAGRKLKYFARGNLGLSDSLFKSLKMMGGLRVNGKIARADAILQTGDLVEISILEPVRAPVEPDFTPVSVVYEDEDMLVIDKPAPLACQVSEKQSGFTLENRLAARYGQDFVFRPLNRLDKGTSGLLCAAKHAHACQLMQQTLHTGEFVREYLAVVCGALAGAGTIDLPIAKADGATIRREVSADAGKRAVTHWTSLRTGDAYSLVRLRLETGRTHQIRVHMAAIGHPVAGDFLYGLELPELPGRFALHAARVRLTQPLTGREIDVESPLPDALRSLLER